VVLAAIKNDGKSLEFASESFKNDKELVIAAVKNYGFSLEFASKSLKNN